jgi:hypothetical protein
MNFLHFWVIDFNPSERMGAFFPGAIAGKLDQFVLTDISPLGDSSLPNDLKEGIVFHFGHKIDALGNPLGKETVVIVSPIIDHNGSRSKGHLPGNLDVRYLAFGNPSKGGKVAVMVQEEMQLDGAFGAAEMSPVKETEGKIDDGGIQADQFVFKPELFVPDSLPLEAMEENQEEFLIEGPGAVFVRVGEGGAVRGGNAQVFQFALTTSETSDDFPEGMGSTQMTEEHGDELAPAGEPSGMAFRVGLLDGLLEFRPWKEL